MSRLDDLQAQLDARMAELSRRIDAGERPDMAPPPPPAVPPSPVAPRSAGAGFGAVGERGFPEPVDDSAPPTLRPGDIHAVEDFDIRALGVPPGGETSVPPGTLMAQIMDALARNGITTGTCEFVQPGVQSKTLYPPVPVLLRGVSEGGERDEEKILHRVCRVAAYYALRWRWRKIDDVTVRWAYAEAVADASGSSLRSVGYCDNAFCSPQEGGKTVLCFSPKHSNQETAGHEYTHAVSQETVDWIAYAGEPGAINESFSDIFGKFARWAWEGRELRDGARWLYNGIRDMAHPDQFEGRGWRVASYYKQPPRPGEPQSGWYTGKKDNGGVHLNNGVVTRLCFLLCEGETFTRDDGRRFVVQPIGHARAEELFGTIMFGKRRYVPRAATMHSLFNGLRLAARDLRFSDEETRNLTDACDAVNIIPPDLAESRGFAAERTVQMNMATPKHLGGSASVAQAVAETFARELGLSEAGAGYVVERDAPLAPVAAGGAAERGAPEDGEREIVLEQTYDGIPVFGASATVRVRDGGLVTHFQNGFSKSLGWLRGSKDRIGPDGARQAALARNPGNDVSELSKIVWDPQLLALEGGPALAWRVVTESGGVPDEQVIVDAFTGAVLFAAPLRTS